MTVPDESWPIVLPHLVGTGGEGTWLGAPLPAEQQGWPDLLAGCDGGRPLAELSPETRSVLGAARAAGYVVVAGPPRPAGPGGRVVVVSPHPDDAVLSVGGQLHGTGATVVDVFSRERWTSRPHYVDRPELTEQVLVAEERVACRVLGVDPVLGGLDDAPQRRWQDGFLVDRPEGTEVVRAEPEVASAVRDLLRPHLGGAAEVLAPLGHGGHVDHIHCREAVLALVAEGVVDPARVALYEDVPASLFAGVEGLVGALGARLGAPLGAETRPVPELGVAAQAEALRAYRLQVPSGVVTRVGRCSRRRAGGAGGAERVWRLSEVDEPGEVVP